MRQAHSRTCSMRLRVRRSCSYCTARHPAERARRRVEGTRFLVGAAGLADQAHYSGSQAAVEGKVDGVKEPVA